MTHIRNFPQDIASPGRRSFLRSLVGAAGAAALPVRMAAVRRASASALADASASLTSDDPGDEAFWASVRDQFSLRKRLILLNAANLCPSPLTVQQRVIELTRDLDSDPSFANRGKFAGLKEAARNKLAAYLGADADEIALVRNTSEGNNTVISGLPLGRGDEVVIWDQNHPTANVAWDVRAQRYGYSVKRVSTPPLPEHPGRLLQPFVEALTPRTRVLAFSHVSNVTGVRIDAEKLCALARDRGVLTLVDGAQTLGTWDLDLHALGCDFFTGSAHKWLCGPREVGVLYVRRERIERLFPLSVGVGWENALRSGARKFETLGQQDDARISAMNEIVDFHNRIGKRRVAGRALSLADAVRRGLKRTLKNVEFVTPEDHAMSWGVVVFNAPGLVMDNALDALYVRYGVGCAVMGTSIRYSPHVYNDPAEIDKAAEAVAGLA